MERYECDLDDEECIARHNARLTQECLDEGLIPANGGWLAPSVYEYQVRKGWIEPVPGYPVTKSMTEDDHGSRSMSADDPDELRRQYAKAFGYAHTSSGDTTMFEDDDYAESHNSRVLSVDHGDYDGERTLPIEVLDAFLDMRAAARKALRSLQEPFGGTGRELSPAVQYAFRDVVIAYGNALSMLMPD